MRALLHLVSVVLALPGIVLAAAFLALGHAIAARSLPAFIAVLFEMFVWLVPWGLLASVLAVLALLLGGFSRRLRRYAAACVALLAAASSGVVLMLTTRHDNFEPGQLGFFIPAALAATIGLWLAVTERAEKPLPIGQSGIAPAP